MQKASSPSTESPTEAPTEVPTEAPDPAPTSQVCAQCSGLKVLTKREYGSELSYYSWLVNSRLLRASVMSTSDARLFLMCFKCVN